MKTVCGLALTTVLTLGLGSHALAAIYYVDARVSTSGNGTTDWAAAKKTIQEAVDIVPANQNHEIRIAGRIADMQANPPIPGLIYTPTNQSSGYIELKSGVRILGGYRGNDGTSNNPDDRDPATFVTILSGNVSGGQAKHVVLSPPNTGPPSSGSISGRVNLDGFIIEDGYASSGYDGGGIYFQTSTNNAEPVIRNCIIRNNISDELGGGVYSQSGTHPVFRNCQFTSNSALVGGAVAGAHAARYTFVNCVFDSNVADWSGGAVAGPSRTFSMSFINCTFKNNEVSDANGFGGAIYLTGTTLVEFPIVNCLFINNSADEGGAIYLGPNLNVDIKNCTFSANTAVTGGAVYATSISSNCIVDVYSSIFWDDAATTSPEIHVNGAVVSVYYSNVEGGWSGAGSGNIGSTAADDPDFIGNGNYRLQCDSPCINMGDIASSNVEADADDANENGNITEKIDLDLQQRLIARVDMGAYETQVVVTCAADVAPTPCRDNVVNVVDLLAVINAWGSCPSAPAYCIGDVNLDGTVGVTDLLAVITSWGPCGNPQDMPQSIEDCMDKCSESYTTYSTEWQACVDACVQALCELELIDCD